MALEVILQCGLISGEATSQVRNFVSIYYNMKNQYYSQMKVEIEYFENYGKMIASIVKDI